MTRLHDLYTRGGQSPWIDNLKRAYLRDGTLQTLIDDGIRGLTSNPTIFQKAIAETRDYDDQMASLSGDITSVYWELVLDDIRGACDAFFPLYDESQGRDGYVSLEVSPELAHDHLGTVEMARDLAHRVDRPNVMIKIPATLEGLPAIADVIADGISVNATLIFSVKRYESVMEAYLEGLERHAERPDADLGKVSGVASFFVSRVDSAVDKRLDEIGSPEALRLRGKAAIAQAQLAFQSFSDKFAGPRWERLAERGALPQRVLWASTSTKNPAYDELLYVEPLIGPNTVNTMPEPTVQLFAERGVVERTIDRDVEAAGRVMANLATVGVDMALVTAQLEAEGVAAFQASFRELLAHLEQKRSIT